MELSKNELANFTCVNNQVLIKVTRTTDEIEYKSLKIKYVNTYDNYRNAVVTGEVVAIPNNLQFGPNHMTALTPLEIQKGDTVWYKYMAYVNAMPGPNQDIVKHYTVKGDDAHYILVDYQSLIMAKRGEDAIPLNGFMIIEPLPAEDLWESDVLEHDQLTKDRYKYSETYGVVKYAGTPVTKYWRDQYVPDDPNVNVGDIVAIDVACDIPFEVDLHRTFERENQNPYWRVLRRDILGVVGHVN